MALDKPPKRGGPPSQHAKRERTIIDVAKKDFLTGTGARPPRSKSTNAKPSKPQQCNVPGRGGGHGGEVSALTQQLSALSLKRTGSANSNRSNHNNNGRPPRLTGSRGGSALCQSLDDVVRYIAESRARQIVVMCGAGISTASGIPDFRSPGTGLYANLKQYNIPYPESIFDLDYFEGNPKPFYTLAKELYPSAKYRPNYVHYFLRILHEKGLLLRIYTQNIDGLERMAGLPAEKLVEAHGSFYTASCIKCRERYASDVIRGVIYSDKLPRCHKNRCLGLIKPDIVFFGEDLPRRFYYYLRDFPQADMLLVMGTSLEVEPFAGIVDSVRLTVPRVLFNRQAVGPFKRRRRLNDVVVTGDIPAQLQRAAEQLGWQREIEGVMSETAQSLVADPCSTPAQDDTSLSAAGVVAHPSSTAPATRSAAQKSAPALTYHTGVHRGRGATHKQHSVSAAPHTDSSRGGGGSRGGGRRTARSPLQVTGDLGELLPRLRHHPPPSFHAQAALSRSEAPRPRYNFLCGAEEEASSGEEESESDSDDD